MSIEVSYACGVQVVDHYSIKSFRLMAVAAGNIPSVESLDLHGMSHQRIESKAVNLRLLVLVVLTNHIRVDSLTTIAELQEG